MLSIQFKGEILQNQYSSILIKIKLTTSIVVTNCYVSLKIRISIREKIRSESWKTRNFSFA